MKHPTSLLRRLAGAGVASVVVVAGLAAGPAAAPVDAAAPAPAAAAAPDRYTPRTGATFNKPTGTRAKQYRIFRHINRTIRSATRGEVIRMAVFSFADLTTANNLIGAHRRGVRVKLVFDRHAVFPAQRKLRRALGTNHRSRSFAMFCERSCRSKGPEMHAKFFQFSRAGSARHITMVGSNNMTSTNAEKQWSDVMTIANNKAVYSTFRVWFNQLKRDVARRDPKIAARHGDHLAILTPTGDRDDDPALKALGPVRCLTPVYGTDPRTGERVVRKQRKTRVFISTHAWFGPRGHAIGRKVARLAENGCRVKVFYAEKGLGKEIKSMLRSTPAKLRTSSSRGIRTHQKLLIVRGNYGGNKDADFVWTGSHNWTPHATRVDDVVLRTANNTAVGQYTRNFFRMFRNG